MSTQIFVNLPVADLRRSIAFFTRLGFSYNEQFTDDTATCMVIGDNIFVMLLVRDRFQSFTPKPVCDAMRHSVVLVCLLCVCRVVVVVLVCFVVVVVGL